MQVLAIVNPKGGGGKTTSAVTIAALLGEAGQRVLLIDLDPQAGASLSLGVRDTGDAVLQSLHKSTGLPVRSTKARGVSLVPSGRALSAARRHFSGEIGSGLFKRSLERTEGDWDWAVIDCPPGDDILILSALRAAAHVLIPVETTYLGLTGLWQIIDTIEARRSDGGRAEILAVIPCRAHPGQPQHREIMEKLCKLFPGRVTPVVREDESVAVAPASGLPVFTTAPESTGARDYRAVVEFLQGLLRAQPGAI
jgi:chromosome partitioning protein